MVAMETGKSRVIGNTRFAMVMKVGINIRYLIFEKS
jgi:hypothetical protein